MISRRLLIALTPLLLGAMPAQAQTTAAPVKAAASFSILADLVHQVGGDRVTVSALVGPNGDAHEFEPSPADAKTLADAKVIVVNGLGLEGWFDRLIKAAGSKAPVIVASKGVAPIAGAEAGTDHRHRFDPHAWQSIANAKIYVGNIRAALDAIDPDGKASYDAHATRYLATLDALEGDVKAGIAAIPAQNRKIITTHDAFGYFGKAYGMEFVAPQGVSTESEASAQDVARIIRQIRAEKIPAVFLENISDPRLMQRIAEESGAKVGAKLYSDALSEPGGPAATYVDMMRNNLAAFRAALGG